MYPVPCSPVQHLGGCPFQLLQDLQQLSVIITQAAPAQDPCQVITSPQWQDTQLTLHERDKSGWGLRAAPKDTCDTPNPTVPTTWQHLGHTECASIGDGASLH